MGLTVSRGISGILLLMLLGMGLAGCGQMRPSGSTQVINYTVKPGDTLYSISWRYGYDHRQVAAWNRIPEPYTIYVGQTIRIIPPYQQTVRGGPVPAQTTTAARSSPSTTTRTAPATTSQPAPTQTTAPARQAPVASSSPPPRTATVPPPAPRPAQPASTIKVVWAWPTRGTQKYPFDVNAGKKGIGIAGTLGQPIRAAADGEVVYSGSGLIGYGNLLIIKHDSVYLSAYGHNRRLLVQEGAKVKRGQKIAEMGESNRDGVILHFEIRRDGNPVNPLGYLPKTGS